MEFERKDRYGIGDLLDIVRLLRLPGGCPWDAAQDHRSIRKGLIEETYEVADAIDRGDAELLCEELGDVLLQVVMHARMEEENGVFDFGGVCDGVCKKLIHRHPHVFGQMDPTLSVSGVLENWEELKNAEKGRQTAEARLADVPACLPALMRSAKVQKRAAPFGFGYGGVGEAAEDLRSELRELDAALCGEGDAAAEIGDVLFSAVNVARLLDVEPEEALSRATARFARRVTAAERAAAAEGKALAALSGADRDALWRRAKADE